MINAVCDHGIPTTVTCGHCLAAGRIKDLEDALRLIAGMGGMTLIGGGDMEPRRAHELGANKAFNQAAEIAASALQNAPDPKRDEHG